MENQRLGCMNRDTNACYNLRKIYEHYLLTGERLESFKRKQTSPPQLTTDANLSVSRDVNLYPAPSKECKESTTSGN